MGKRTGMDHHVPDDRKPSRWPLYLVVLAGFLHLLSREGHSLSLLSYPASDFLRIIAVVLVATAGYWALRSAGAAPVLAWVTGCGAILFLGSVVISVMTGSSEFVQVIYDTSVMAMMQEIMFTSGLCFLILAFMSAIRVLRATKQSLQTERSELIHEIAERNKAEKSLKESENILQKLADNLPQVFWMIDASSNRLLYINPAYESILGRSSTELFDNMSLWLRYVHPDDRHSVKERFKQAALRQRVNVQFRIARPDGSWRWLDTNIFPVQEEDGKVYVAGITQDITEQKKLEMDRIQAYSEIELRVAERTASLREANRRLQEEIDERVRIEQALRDSQERYRTLAEAAKDIIFIIDGDDRVEYANSAAAAFLGMPQQDIIGKPRCGLFPSVTDARQYHNLREVMRSGKPISIESKPFPEKDIWHDTHLVPIKSTSSDSIAILGISRDVTERKLSEQALRESEQRYRAVVEDQTEFICRFLPDTTLTFANDTTCRYFGKSREELLGARILDLVFERDRDLFLEHMEQVKSLKRPLVFEHDLPNSAGEVRKFTWLNRPIFGADGRLVEFQGVGRDITNMWRVQQALRESEEKYRSLIEGLNEAVYRATVPGGRYEYIGPAASRVFGYSAEYLMDPGVSFVSIVHPDSRKYLREFWAEVKRGNVSPTCEYRVIDPDGNERWIMQSNKLCFDAAGAPIALEGICRDFTEQKRIQQTVEEHRTRLRQASKMSILGEMAASIAHEINNPLNIISGSAEQLQTLVDNSPIRTDIVKHLSDVIMRHVFRVKQIITGLRNYSRDGSQDPFCPVPLQSIIDDTIALSRQNLVSCDIALSVNGLPDDLLLECRPTQIMQVLVNLMSNSIHAIEGLAERWIEISTANWQDGVEIAVIDSGHGISPEITPQLFKPMTASKEPGAGTGLGLSISRRIIESHNGTLEYQTRDGRTCFVIRMPKELSHKKAV
jgi:PAS domain S-box-containing protein